MMARSFLLLTLFLGFCGFIWSVSPVFAGDAENAPAVQFVHALPDFPLLINNGIDSGRALIREHLAQRAEDLRPRWMTLHENLRDIAWRVYRSRMVASRGGYVNNPSIIMEATAYDPGPISCGPYADGRTATGMHAGYGIAAVDPRFIRLGTHLYVEGYGYAIAADVGSAIKGDRIDLCFNSYDEAIRFGRRKVRVYILNH